MNPPIWSYTSFTTALEKVGNAYEKKSKIMASLKYEKFSATLLYNDRVIFLYQLEF
jgi:hypothetical protein